MHACLKQGAVRHEMVEIQNAKIEVTNLPTSFTLTHRSRRRVCAVPAAHPSTINNSY